MVCRDMYRIITMAAITSASTAMTDYLALAVVLATVLAMSVDSVTGALLMAILIGYTAPAITRAGLLSRSSALAGCPAGAPRGLLRPALSRVIQGDDAVKIPFS